MEPSSPPMPPNVARRLVTSDLKEPIVFKGMIDQWICRSWSLRDWGEKLGDLKMRFRIGEIDSSNPDPTWEADCDYLEGTVTDFVSWLENEDSTSSTNCFKSINRKRKWCYADYKYMAELFENDSEMLQIVDWSGFGFPNRCGRESSLWIGSRGSHTPCHYDTYGCNLVAQLCGKKRWTLFPPWQTDNLHPTRIPYEESSVFSKINIQKPQTNIYPSVKETTPYLVYLNPGDILFVPRHWWHFVESVEPSVAVNTWLELDEDDDSRVEEAITRLLVASLAPVFNLKDWLNPTDEFTSPELNLVYLQTVLKKRLENEDNTSQDSVGTPAGRDPPPSSLSVLTTCKTSSVYSKDVNSDPPSPPIKKPRRDERYPQRMMVGDDILQEYKDSLVPIRPISFDDYLNLLSGCQPDTATSANPLRDQADKFRDPLDGFSEKFLNCLVNPKTVSVIAESLKKLGTTTGRNQLV